MKRFVLPALFFCAAIAGFAQEAPSRAGDEWYQGKIIKDIVFSGLRHVKETELEGLMEPYKGLPFDDSLFWEIQGRLYALEYFDLISPGIERADYAGNEIIIRFTVTERPTVGRINFIGNSGIRRHELLETITIKNNDVVNRVKLTVDEQAIVNKYLGKGYPDVKVRSEIQAASGSTVVINFYITEGDKISISEFRFEGNSVFSARTLRGRLSLKAKSLLSDGAFQEAKLIADIASITQYYHERGYIDAEIVDVTREIEKDAKENNNMILTFRIKEGRIYTFGGVTFEGNQIFSTEQLSALIKSKTGEKINARRLQADLQSVSDLYYENGYIFNVINRDERKNPVEGIVAYHITIVERGRAHIENIIVKGNDKTRTDVIMREVPLEPGDVFSKAKVEEAWRNLMNLQYFSSVSVETPFGSEDSLMDLVFVVEEQPTVDLQLGLTFSGSADPDTFPVSALVKWNDRNLKGSGNQLGVDANGSFDTVSVSVNYNQRWMFGLPFSGGFDFTGQWAKRLAAMNSGTISPIFNGDETYAYPDGFASWGEYNSANKTPPREYLMDYQQWYFSLGFSTGYRWFTPAGILSVGGGIRGGLINNRYDDDIYRPFDPALRERHNEWTPKTSIYGTVSLDQRDLYYDPSKGYYAYERFGIYGLLGKDLGGRLIEREYYIRNDLKAEYYLTLFNIPVTEKWNFKSVLAFHSGLSFIFRQPGRASGSLTPTPIIEEANQLSVDGMFNGRGWNSEYRYKGLVLWENWVELRFPIVPGVLSWDFFFDAAGVEASLQGENRTGIAGYYFKKGNFTIDNMRFSFGGGLRFTLPQFPLRFSLAKRFRTYDGKFTWEQGSMFQNDNPASGIDPVLSFVISY
ncbi:MAG: outer membrane protein assembly factor BamA [Treponema sp.]|jgi:outer membrane protein insertion porin family|nr:outer membrane protein assembly factor BamA [Treponema sp.]